MHSCRCDFSILAVKQGHLEVVWGGVGAATPALRSCFFLSAVSVPAKRREPDEAGALSFLEPEQV